MPDQETGARLPFRMGAVVLAAGGSSRMGAVKQLLELEGRPLIVRAVDAALGAPASPVVVVLGADAERVRAPIARHPVSVVVNPEWSSGIASSIRAGMAALLAADPGLDAVLVALCDQPALSPEIIGRLAGLHRATGRIAAARYDGRNGAPAVFGRRHFAALGSLEGDAGARRLLNGSPGSVAAADIPEMGVDLDTPADCKAWMSRKPRP
ncbi:MAG TPA: nucleotidyltransferase family protein [Opitutaceae bacterium]|nr:nucleotidyltransferase family protein [Opitutaceae bacterium]